MQKFNFFIYLLIGFFLIGKAESKQFKNAYIAFEIPDRWSCLLESTEWVCRSQESNESKEAIIILTAKEASNTNDSFPIYEDHLKKPIKIMLRSGTEGLSSVVTPPKQIQLNNLVWIDGFHLGSEIQNYYTRYLATIKDRIAVLVTFSAHKDFYSKYSQDFFKALNSLNVIATKNSLGDPSIQGPSGTLGPLTSGGGSMEIPGIEPASGQDRKGGKIYFLIAALVLAVAGVILLIKLKKK